MSDIFLGFKNISKPLNVILSEFSTYMDSLLSIKLIIEL